MSYERGMVPTSTVIPLLRRGMFSDFGPNPIDGGAPRSLVRTLAKWEAQDCEWVEFDGVDRALSRVDMVHTWREEEPESYYSPNLSAPHTVVIRRCERVGCSIALPVKQGGRPKHYCSFACYKVEYEARRNGRKRVAGKRNVLRGMVCAKGHDLHGDNVREKIDKLGHRHRWCHQCKMDRQRADRLRQRRIAAVAKGRLAQRLHSRGADLAHGRAEARHRPGATGRGVGL